MNTKIKILASFLWGLAVLSALVWNTYDQNQAQKKLAFQTARAFFQQIDWKITLNHILEHNSVTAFVGSALSRSYFCSIRKS
jgi:hypothetical protein